MGTEFEEVIRCSLSRMKTELFTPLILILIWAGEARAQLPIKHLLRFEDEGKEAYEHFDDSIEDIVISEVPEILLMVKYCYCYSRSECPSGMPIDSCQHKLYMRVSHPDPKSRNAYERNFYDVEVGEDAIDHSLRWHDFLLNKHTGEIIYQGFTDDYAEERYVPMSRYKKSKLWEEDIAFMKKWLRTHRCK